MTPPLVRNRAANAPLMEFVRIPAIGVSLNGLFAVDGVPAESTHSGVHERRRLSIINMLKSFESQMDKGNLIFVPVVDEVFEVHVMINRCATGSERRFVAQSCRHDRSDAWHLVNILSALR